MELSRIINCSFYLQNSSSSSSFSFIPSVIFIPALSLFLLFVILFLLLSFSPSLMSSHHILLLSSPSFYLFPLCYILIVLVVYHSSSFSSHPSPSFLYRSLLVDFSFPFPSSKHRRIREEWE